MDHFLDAPTTAWGHSSGLDFLDSHSPYEDLAQPI
jgi:hypothetical protein